MADMEGRRERSWQIWKVGEVMADMEGRRERSWQIWKVGERGCGINGRHETDTVAQMERRKKDVAVMEGMRT